MTWFASSANEAESAAPHARLFKAVDLEFPSGNARYWTGTGEITIGGDVFAGLGELVSISDSPENVRLVAERKTFQISGADPATIPESDIDDCYGMAAKEYFGFMDADGNLVDTPEVNWEGRLDAISRVDLPTPVIEIQAEHRLIVLDESAGSRYTDEHQQRLFAGDLGFNQISTVENKTVIWGGKIATVGTVYNAPQDTGY